MEHASNAILEVLRERGHRVTKAREHIIDVLARQRQPQTTQELAQAVAADEASVYRTMQLLRGAGLLEEIHVAGERPKFSLAHGHHHHIVCNTCGRVAHIPCERITAPQTLPKDFATVHDHDVTFHGLCKKCA